MSVLTRLRSAAGVVARSTIRRTAKATLARTADCVAAQRDVLRELLALNADSQFSVDHGLQAATTADELRGSLPVADYERFRPYVERVAEGERMALLGRDNELLMFSLSSGTTGQSKLIPITQRFLDDYRRGWQTWGIHMLDDHFAQNRKNMVQLISDYELYHTPGGTPCGNISGLVTAMQKKIVRLMYTLPPETMKITDADAKYYTTLRIALADRDVGMFTTANPSTLVRLAHLMHDRAESLVRDLRDGTLSDEYDVPTTVRRSIARNVSRQRVKRARELDRVLERTGTLKPRDAWPQLELLAVWTGGSCAHYLDRVREFYGDLPVRDHGLHASEGRMTIPLEDDTSSGVLDVTSHFFEFVPVEEYESEHRDVLLAHELDEGREYYILLTTASGLYRYDIQDVVRCTGFHGTTPKLAFMHKGAHVSSLTGEKLSETQVVSAVREGLDGGRHRIAEFALSPEWGDPPRYQLLLECEPAFDDDAVGRLATTVDARLKELNVEYREKRETGRLDPLVGRRLVPGTWGRFAAWKRARSGGSSEQYKHPCLVPDLDFAERVLALQHGETLDTPATAETSAAAQATRRSKRERVAD